MAGEAQRIVVLGFDSRIGAQEGFDMAVRLQHEGKLVVRDAVFVTRDEKGHVRVEETTDPSIGASSLGGAVWGLLFGAILLVPVAGMAIGAGVAALTARLIDSGLSDSFVKKLRESIQPGRTYLALLVSHANREAVLVELERMRGIASLEESTLPDESVQQVKEALAAQPGS